MNNEPQNLEQRLGRPDWKQWLPVYGLYQMSIDLFAGRPSLMHLPDRELTNEEHLAILASICYQASSVVAAYYGINALFKLAEKLF